MHTQLVEVSVWTSGPLQPAYLEKALAEGKETVVTLPEAIVTARQTLLLQSDNYYLLQFLVEVEKRSQLEIHVLILISLMTASKLQRVYVPQ